MDPYVFDEGTILMDDGQDQQQTHQAQGETPLAFAGAPVGPPTPYVRPMAPGQVGEVRETGMSILLYVVTIGIYGLIWRYKTHDELKRYSGEGVGGGLALLLAFVPFVLFFVTPREIGRVYERRGQKAPVSGLTGLWLLLPLAGGIVWFAKTNNALNAFWRSLGAQ